MDLCKTSGTNPAGKRHSAQGSLGLDGRLQKEAGKPLLLTLYDEEADGSVLRCKVLDTDREWALLLLDEGKKNEREMLVRLDSVRQVKSVQGLFEKCQNAQMTALFPPCFPNFS